MRFKKLKFVFAGKSVVLGCLYLVELLFCEMRCTSCVIGVYTIGGLPLASLLIAHLAPLALTNRGNGIMALEKTFMRFGDI